jgi:adenylate cyclase class 2
MSYEVELKFRACSHDELVRRLAALGGSEEPELSQEDIYWNHPARDFARSGEAFRIRRTGDDNRITYKGPKWSGPTKTREELEIPFEPGAAVFEQMSRLLENLGFRATAAVRKSRRPFHLTFQGWSMEIALDTVEGLGEFVEVEAIAEHPDDLPRAQAAVLDLASALELDEIEPRSYLRMILERAGS